MDVVLIALGAIAYLQCGFHLGKAGTAVWKRKDNVSVRSYLLFPAHHLRRRIGHGSLPLCEGVNPETAFYRAWVLACWPAMVALNAVTVAVTLPSWIAARPARLRAANARRANLLAARNRLLDERIRRLEADDAPARTRVAPIRRIRVVRDDDRADERAREEEPRRRSRRR